MGASGAGPEQTVEVPSGGVATVVVEQAVAPLEAKVSGAFHAIP